MCFRYELTVISMAFLVLSYNIQKRVLKQSKSVLSSIKDMFPDNVLQFFNWNVWIISYTREGNMGSALHLLPYCSPERSSSGSLDLSAAASPLQLQMFSSFPLVACSREEEGKKICCWVLHCMAARWAVTESTHAPRKQWVIIIKWTVPVRCPRPSRAQDWGGAQTCVSWLLASVDYPGEDRWSAEVSNHRFSLSQCVPSHNNTLPWKTPRKISAASTELWQWMLWSWGIIPAKGLRRTKAVE